MKKKVAKLFKKYGDGEIKIIKNYQPKSRGKGDTTIGIIGNRMHINIAIGNCILFGDEKEKECENDLNKN